MWEHWTLLILSTQKYPCYRGLWEEDWLCVHLQTQNGGSTYRYLCICVSINMDCFCYTSSPPTPELLPTLFTVPPRDPLHMPQPLSTCSHFLQIAASHLSFLLLLEQSPQFWEESSLPLELVSSPRSLQPPSFFSSFSPILWQPLLLSFTLSVLLLVASHHLCLSGLGNKPLDLTLVNP